MLASVYIAQNVRDEGALAKDFDGSAIDRLEIEGLVEKSTWHKHILLKTTPKGAMVGSPIISRRIVGNELELERCLGGRRNLVRMLAHHVFLDDSIWPRSWSFFDWRDEVVSQIDFKAAVDSVAQVLQTLGLAFPTNYYVSTRGGDIREEVKVIPREVQKFFADTEPLPLDVLETKDFRLAHFLRTAIETYKVKGDDSEAASAITALRMSDDLVTIGEVEALLANAGSQGSEAKLIRNKSGYLLKADPRLEEFINVDWLSKAVARLLASIAAAKVTPDDATSLSEDLLNQSPLRNYLKLYLEIGQIELALRQVVKKRLEERLGTRWLEQQKIEKIVQNWKDRKKEDEEAHVLPEPDLINYADLADYGRIIEAFNKIFGDLFPVVKSLWRVNALGRRAVMHFRSLDDMKMQVTMYEIQFLKEGLRDSSQE